ncbi:MAG: hypothetical protein ACYSTY_10545 [Planctomycetota bacterium]
MVVSAGLIAGLVAEVYGYPLRGGTPVSVNIVKNTLSANEDSVVQVPFDQDKILNEEVTIVYRILTQGHGEDEWKSYLMSPPLKFWSNDDLLQFKIKRNNQAVPEFLTLEIYIKSGSMPYPNVKDTVVLQ